MLLVVADFNLNKLIFLGMLLVVTDFNLNKVILLGMMLVVIQTLLEMGVVWSSRGLVKY